MFVPPEHSRSTKAPPVSISVGEGWLLVVWQGELWYHSETGVTKTRSTSESIAFILLILFYGAWNILENIFV